MSEVRFANGVLVAPDPELFATWKERPDYLDGLVRSPDPELEAKKRLVMEFEVALGRVLTGGRVDEEIDPLLERYLTEGYIQHDPNLENGREALAARFREGVEGPEPLPVGLIAEGDLVTVLLRLPPQPDPLEPGATYDRFLPAVFRVEGDRVAEHWGPMDKVVPPK